MPCTSCRHFNGYKPCGRHTVCDEQCPSKDIPQSYILIIHLEAMGAVLRATSLLPAIKRKFPGSHITWVTQSPSNKFFENNPLVDRVLTCSEGDLLQLSALEFDFAFVVDKSLKAAGVLRRTQCDYVFGFQVEARGGAIVPATAAAEELWHLGLNDQKKFFENSKPETQLMVEALELGAWQRDEYQLFLSQSEKEEAYRRKNLWSPKGLPVIGLNTGCSTVIKYKKMSVDLHRQLIVAIGQSFNAEIVLLGGPEDTQRNLQIAKKLNVHVSATEDGLRDGVVSAAACDLIVSGDSLGMHMAIALKKWVVAWFGPTCAHEIDLYDRGVFVQSRVSCGPCWKRNCAKTPLCSELVDIDDIVSGLAQGFSWLKKSSSFRQPLSETYY